MIRNFLIILSLLLACAGGFFYWQYSSKKTLLTPFPYSFNATAQKSIESELSEAGSAKILIVGDRMGENLKSFTPELLLELGKSFSRPPKIFNWARPHEGLHRTLFKLKSLKKLPSIIIYHGASSELYEKKFDVSDAAAIIKNFQTFDDEKKISLIITFPWLSKILYRKMHYFDLGTIKEYKNLNAGSEKMTEKEISFKLFDYELRELVDLVKDKKSNLILITTPLNLEIAPKEICAQSTSNTIIEVQQTIDELLKEGNFKTAYPKALELSNETYSNALSFYQLGKASLGLGEIAKARIAFQKASVFDCANWRGNAVYNAIMKTEAKKRQIELIDFDQFMASSLSKDTLFIDEYYPQNIFYQNMMSELKDSLKKILSVND